MTCTHAYAQVVAMVCGASFDSADEVLASSFVDQARNYSSATTSLVRIQFRLIIIAYQYLIVCAAGPGPPSGVNCLWHADMSTKPARPFVNSSESIIRTTISIITSR